MDTAAVAHVIVQIGLALVSPAVSATVLSARPTSPDIDDPARVPIHGVFELTLGAAVDLGGQANQDEVDVVLTVVAPSGPSTTVHGFFWGLTADGEALWKARFAPRETGSWSYSWSWTHTPTAEPQIGAGTFETETGKLEGFIEIDPADPLGWRTATGRPLHPVGLNDCFGANDRWLVDGGDRNGAFAAVGVPADIYLETYSAAGFNTFRLSPWNCSEAATDANLSTYDLDFMASLDRLMFALRRHGFHIMYGVFGYFIRDNPGVAMVDVERFARYSVDRWGALADIWQLVNETTVSDSWIDAVAAAVRSRDPYDQPISTSWERPSHPAIDVSSPHNYTDPSIGSDEDPFTDLTLWGGSGKPLLFGERGNFTSNWLPSSDVGTRLRFWGSLAARLGYIAWNTAYATNGVCCGTANSWLGPQIRDGVQALDRILRSGYTAPVTGLAASVDHPWLRTRAVRTTDRAIILVTNWIDPSVAIAGATLTVDLPAADRPSPGRGSRPSRRSGTAEPCRYRCRAHRGSAHRDRGDRRGRGTASTRRQLWNPREHLDAAALVATGTLPHRHLAGDLQSSGHWWADLGYGYRPDRNRRRDTEHDLRRRLRVRRRDAMVNECSAGNSQGSPLYRSSSTAGRRVVSRVSV